MADSSPGDLTETGAGRGTSMAGHGGELREGERELGGDGGRVSAHQPLSALQ